MAAIGLALALQVVPANDSAHAATIVTPVGAPLAAATPVPGVDLQVTLTGPQAAVPGTTFTDSILITNVGTDPATAVTFDLTPPVAGATYAITDPGVSCNVSWHCTLTSPTDLASLAQRAVSLSVTTAAPLSDGSLVRPIVQVSTTATDVDPSNDTAVQQTSLSQAGQLAVVIQRTSTGQLLPGQRASYKITLTNNGPNVALAPEVFARPVAAPYSLQQTATAAGATCRAAGNQGVWSCLWTSIPAGQSRVMTFSATASPHLLSGSFLVTAQAVSDNSADAYDSVAAAVVDNNLRPVDVSVTTYTTPKLQVGEKGIWKVTVTNHGPFRAHDVVLTETLPKGFTWKDLKGRGKVEGSGRTHSTRVGSLETGGSVVLDGWFTYNKGASLTWKSSVSHSDPDSKKTNNAQSSTTKVLGPVVTTLSTKPTSDGTVVKTTNTSGTTDSGASKPDDTVYDDGGQVISSGTTTDKAATDKKELADTGGPALRLPLLGFGLVLLGSVSTASARQRRPAPRHRAWISPYA